MITVPDAPRTKPSPFKTQGIGGTAIWSGYVDSGEGNYKLSGPQRHISIANMLTNVSIVAAGVRYFLNLAAKPTWRVEPAEDIGEGESSDEAKELADLTEEILYDMDTSWNRIIRRSANYRFHGFGIQEWTARMRDDGTIGMADIRPRPQHTVVRWDLDEHSVVKGLWQQSPQSLTQIYLPRGKLIYLVDDTLSDSPEGLGTYRHLAELANRLEAYHRLEGIGFERDMRGIPIGRAPYTAIRKAVDGGKITQELADKMLGVMENFVQTEVTGSNTGLVLDSALYETAGTQGVEPGSNPMWGMELLTGGATASEEVNTAINRTMEEMARILGVEGLLLGSGEAGGNRALGQDKSQNLYLVVNSALGDLEEGYSKDLLDPIFMLNGWPDELKPRLRHEDAAFRDVTQVTAALRDMATAGAVLAPDDPAIDDVRDMIGVSRQPELDPDMIAAMMNQKAGLNPDGTPIGQPGEEEDPIEEEAEDEPPPPTAKRIMKRRRFGGRGRWRK